MKWLPILIALAVLGFLAYRFLSAGPAANTNDSTTNSTPAASDSGNTNRMSGNNGGSTTTGTGSATTANPPGPARAATRP
jgi:hypothetical protein